MFWKSSTKNNANTWSVKNPMGDLPYDLGDMYSDDGQSYFAEIHTGVYATCSDIVNELEKNRIFLALSDIIPADSLRLQLEFSLRTEMYELYKARYIASWHEKRSSNESHSVFWEYHRGLGPLVNTYWPDDGPFLVLGRKYNLHNLVKAKIRPIYNKISYVNWRIRYLFRHFRNPNYKIPKGPNILVKYVQGIQNHKRDDLFWLKTNKISSDNHIVYFDGPIDPYTSKTETSQLLNMLRSMNISYVSLARNNTRDPDCPIISPIWKKGELSRRFERHKFSNKTNSEKWLISIFKELLSNVDYWVSIYTKLNTKIHVDISHGTAAHIAHRIALDLIDGVCIEPQRSEFWPHYDIQLGWHPGHIFLAWNSRAQIPLTENESRVHSIIITGISDDQLIPKDLQSTRSRIILDNTNTTFTVALFDNMFFRNELYSKAMISAWYTEFLEWVISDDEIAVINKPKRLLILERLPELQELMHKAESTGRWVNLTEKHPQISSVDHIPTDASSIADISISMGISSAITEVVAYGSRGVHCDLPILKSHPFYEWGDGQVIFTDLKLMMSKLKAYKHDPNEMSALGNFKDHMEQIDPFHDGKQPERVAQYLCWLIDGFQIKLNRQQAITEANNKYRAMYGYETVIEKSAG